jgi:hypothetical protein
MSRPIISSSSADADAHGRLEDEPDDEGADQREDAVGDNAHDLGAVGRTGIGERNDEGAPDAGQQVNRDGADDVVDLQLVEQRHGEDHDHTTDGTDQDGLPHGGGISGSAVIETRPASAPLSTMVTSTFL